MKKEGEFLDLVSSFADIIRYRPGRELIGRLEDTFRACGLENKKDDIPRVTDWNLHQKKYIVAWQKLKLRMPLYLKSGTNMFSLVWKLPLGVSFADCLAKKDYFSDAVGGFVDMEQTKAGKFTMHILLGSVPAHAKYAFNRDDYPNMELPLPLGWGAAGLIVIDLAKLPHIRVGGTTFSGKSNLLHNMAISLLQNKNARLFVIDLALLEFSYLTQHCVFGSTAPEALKILRYLDAEMHRRRYALNDAGVEKIQNYKGDDLPYLVLIVDEFSFLSPDKTCSDDEKKLRKETHSIMANLAALARKVGIHLIVAMQRPDMNVMPGPLKANFPGAVSFKTIDDVNSQIILDNSAAAKLPNIQGRAIWQVGTKQTEIQVMELPLVKAKKLIKEMDCRKDERYSEFSAKRLRP